MVCPLLLSIHTEKHEYGAYLCLLLKDRKMTSGSIWRVMVTKQTTTFVGLVINYTSCTQMVSCLLVLQSLSNLGKMKKIFLFFLIISCLGLLGNLLRYTATKDLLNLICIVMFAVYNITMAINLMIQVLKERHRV
jgi:Na+/melibiose symporter-like transporter